MDEATLLRLAEDLAIKFALDRFQRGEVRVNAVRQMLDRMGHELETLRKLLKVARRKTGHRGRQSSNRTPTCSTASSGPPFRNPASARC